MNWLILITGIARVIFWVSGLLLVIFLPGRLGGIAYRRLLLSAAFSVVTVSSIVFTVTASGLVDWSGAASFSSALGTLVAALFLAATTVSAWGPISKPDTHWPDYFHGKDDR